MPNPDKILMRKIKKRERKKISLANKKPTDENDTQDVTGNITSKMYLFYAIYVIMN